MHLQKNNFFKHIDFIICDFLSMEIAFIMAYYIRHGNFKLLDESSYRSVMLMLIIANIVSCILFNTMQDVLKRSKQLDFYATLKQVAFTIAFTVFFIFLTKISDDISRNTIILFPFIYLIITYIVRLVYKNILIKKFKRKPERLVVIIATKDNATKIIKRINKFQNDILIKGVVILDKENYNTKTISNVPVVATYEDCIKYLQKVFVDEVFISSGNVDASDIMQKISLMGIVMHIELPEIDEFVGNSNKLYVENIADITVLTNSLSTINPLQYIAKRIVDICFGIIGTIITLFLAVIIGPIIKIKSKGPIFFVQDRVGRNGKVFKMIKFRSMIVDAEEQKAALKEQNENKDGMMFKMKNDPRVIPGIGEFIRKTSIDEFPQFINVLKGEMSVVGTRPPTIDEWEKYDLHHRARLVIKPGITGLWQVSGRSNIKNFEDVVKLDTLYIKTFSLWLDFSIIFKTIKVVLFREGAR